MNNFYDQIFSAKVNNSNSNTLKAQEKKRG